MDNANNEINTYLDHYREGSSEEHKEGRGKEVLQRKIVRVQ